MKSTFLTIALYSIAFALHAEVTLHGIVTYQNTGKKMDALQVSARGASPIITRTNTNKEGEFILTFPNGKVGDVVYLELGTPIYDLVNHKRELEIVLTDKADFKVRVVVCKKGERDANAVEYYNISTKYLETNYQKQIKKKDDNIASLQIQLTKTGANTDALNKQIYDLQLEKYKVDEQLETQKKNAYKLAEDFSHIDLAQADAIYRKAFEAFKAGDIDGARQILNSKEAKQQELDLKKMDTDIQKSESQVQKEEDSIKVAKQRIADAKVQRYSLNTSVIKKKMLDGKLAELQLKFDEAERLYTEGVESDESNIENLSILACFLSDQNETQKAITCYEKGLALALNDELKGNFYNCLGGANLALGKNIESEKFYIKSFQIYEQLVKNDSTKFESDLANVAKNLGTFYHSINKMLEAKKYHLLSFSIYEKLVKNGLIQFESDLANVSGNLGVFYRHVNNMTESEKYYLQSLDILERLVNSDQKKYEFSLGITAENLGVLYYHNNQMYKAEKYFLKTLNIEERLSNINGARYDHDLATTAMNLGGLYKSMNRMLESEKYYLQSLNISEKLAKNNAERFEPDLAWTLNNFGWFYVINKKYDKAQELLSRALDLRQKALLNNQMQFSGEYRLVFNNFGQLRDSLRQEKNYMKVVEIQTKLAKSKEILRVVNTRYALEASQEYNLLSVDALFARQYGAAESAARSGLELDKNQIWLKVDLAHALLFQNKDVASKVEYDALKILINEKGNSFRDVLKGHFDAMEKRGLDKKQLDKARKWVAE